MLVVVAEAAVLVVVEAAAVLVVVAAVVVAEVVAAAVPSIARCGRLRHRRSRQTHTRRHRLPATRRFHRAESAHC